MADAIVASIGNKLVEFNLAGYCDICGHTSANYSSMYRHVNICMCLVHVSFAMHHLLIATNPLTWTWANYHEAITLNIIYLMIPFYLSCCLFREFDHSCIFQLARSPEVLTQQHKSNKIDHSSQRSRYTFIDRTSLYTILLLYRSIDNWEVWAKFIRFWYS